MRGITGAVQGAGSASRCTGRVRGCTGRVRACGRSCCTGLLARAVGLLSTAAVGAVHLGGVHQANNLLVPAATVAAVGCTGGGGRRALGQEVGGARWSGVSFAAGLRWGREAGGLVEGCGVVASGLGYAGLE